MPHDPPDVHTRVSLDAYRSQPDQVQEFLEQAGFLVDTAVRREPMPPETTPHAYLLAAKGRDR